MSGDPLICGDCLTHRCRGVITGLCLTVANARDTVTDEFLLSDCVGWDLGDRNYWKPALQDALRKKGLFLLKPYTSAKREPYGFPIQLMHMLYRIEAVRG